MAGKPYWLTPRDTSFPAVLLLLRFAQPQTELLPGVCHNLSMLSFTVVSDYTDLQKLNKPRAVPTTDSIVIPYFFVKLVHLPWVFHCLTWDVTWCLIFSPQWELRTELKTLYKPNTRLFRWATSSLAEHEFSLSVLLVSFLGTLYAFSMKNYFFYFFI